MSQRWALIETHDPGVDGICPATRVAGLSLIARHVRMAARQGWAGAVVRVADDQAGDEVQRALSREPPPKEFAVELLAGDEAPAGERALVPMRLHAIYTAAELAAAGQAGTPPRPLCTLRSRAELAAAERALFASVRKGVTQDGVFGYYTQRPISIHFTRLFLDTPIMPNHVTLTALVIGLAAAACAAVGGYTAILLAGFLYWFGAIWDCIDGELARLRVAGSKLGEWLDSLTDDVTTFSLLVCLGVGMVRDGYSEIWLYMAVICTVAGVLVQTKLYIDLHRMKRPADTAQYPWFFGTPYETREQKEGGLRGHLMQLFYWLSFLYRRDAFVTIIAIFLVLDLRPAAVGLMCLGVIVLVGILPVHHIVLAIRASRDARS